VVQLDDVVEVFRLAKQNVDTGINLDTFNGRCVGATLVDGDLIGHAVQVESLFKKAPGRSPIPLGGQQEIHCVASTVNYSVEILPLARHLDVGLVHMTAWTGLTFMLTATEPWKSFIQCKFQALNNFFPPRHILLDEF